MKNLKTFMSLTSQYNLRLFIPLTIIMLCAVATFLIWQTAAQMQDNRDENSSAEQLTKDGILLPTLGNYPNATVTIGGDTTVTPTIAPTGTTRINASTNINFKGIFAANPTTGVVRITNAHPAGTYPVTVKAFDNSGAMTTRTFTLTVTNGTICTGTINFTNALNVSTRTFPRGIAIGDFNNDGLQDFATANSGANTVSIRLGNGSGGFSGNTEVPVGISPRNLAIGDFNNDGNQDFVTGNAGSATASIRLGDGLGAFSGTTEINVGIEPRSVVVGDFNNDGNQDFATANVNVSSNTVSIRLGNGLGGFSGTTEISVGFSPFSIATGDFNNDGNQDFATANVSSNTVSIRLGNGLGGFSGTTEISISGTPESVAIGDFNNDGNQDIAVAAPNLRQVSIRLGNGTGNFSGTTNVSFDGNSQPVNVVIGDFNNDNNQDFATITDSATGVSNIFIRLGNGLGAFSGTTVVSVINSSAYLAVGDFNNDGIQDLASTSAVANTTNIRLGNCITSPTPTPTPVITCVTTTIITEGDLFPGGINSFSVIVGSSLGELRSVFVGHIPGGTGLQSLTVVGTPTNANFNILPFIPGTMNFGIVLFTQIDQNIPTDFTLRAASTFHAANIRVRCTIPPLPGTRFDFDGDRKSDISVYRPSNGVWYLQNSTTGFSATQFGIPTDKIAPADYDGDGKTDIAVYRDGVWFVLQSTNGFTTVNFGTATDLPVPADYDGDGKAEFAYYRPSNGVWYFLNSTRNYSLSVVQFGISEDKPTLGDYDGDRRSDIAVYRPSNRTWYQLNSSNNALITTQFGMAEDKPTPADYDGDGRTDIAFYRPSNGVWFLQRSQQGFTALQFGIEEDRPVAADYDGDGKSDIAVYRPSNGVWYLLNSTTGFTAQQFGIAEDKPIPAAFVRSNSP